METVAVLGGGTMGGGIAGHLARAGLEVRLADASAERAENAREALLARTRGHVGAGLLDDTEATEAVRAAADVEAAVDGGGLVPLHAAGREPLVGRRRLRRPVPHQLRSGGSRIRTCEG